MCVHNNNNYYYDNNDIHAYVCMYVHRIFIMFVIY